MVRKSKRVYHASRLRRGAGGATPASKLVFGPDGALFGTAQQGGNASNCGVLFKLWAYGVMANVAPFQGGSGACTPSGGPAIGASGHFRVSFGFSARGGNAKLGSVYQRDQTIFQFSTVTEGVHPTGQPLLDTIGAIFGVATEGARIERASFSN